MSALMHESSTGWDYLLQTWRELDVPEGWRPELTDEGIKMVPPPGGRHNMIADVLHRTLLGSPPEGCGIFQVLGVGVPTLSAILIPDVTVVHWDDVPEDATPVPSEKIRLAAEITSASNAKDDRKKKKWCYAHGGVPLYLLIDPHDPDGSSVSLFSDPREGAYRHVITVPFGDPITLPEPFEVLLDTGRFPA